MLKSLFGFFVICQLPLGLLSAIEESIDSVILRAPATLLSIGTEDFRVIHFVFASPIFELKISASFLRA